MSRFSGGPGMPNHILIIDETPGPEGFGVTCIPHGRLYGAWQTYLEAFLIACQHDDRYSKDWL